MATANEIDKAYKAYKKKLKGLKINPKNRQMLTKAEFIAKNYPNYGKTKRTSHVEQGLKGAGLSYADIQRLKGRKS